MKKPRFTVKFNTGERVHKPKKGKGSYDRKTDKQKNKKDKDK
jgi:stalled ribosome alternative rescue factor ArfA